MQFSSILFGEEERVDKLDHTLCFYRDLNLDQIIDAIVSYKKEYDLKRFFYTPLHNVKSIKYRQAVMKDLENRELFKAVEKFCEKMAEVDKKRQMIKNLDYKEYKNGWFLQMSLVYIEAIETFANVLRQQKFYSKGFILFNDFIQTYQQSEGFKSLQDEVNILKEKLNSIKYMININGLSFRVQKYKNEVDYSQVVKKIFEKFKVDNLKNKECQFEKNRGINHVNAKVLEFVSKLYPNEFGRLENFCQKYDGFIDKIFQTFSEEVQFYMAYIEYMLDFQKLNLTFCYPVISITDKNIKVENGFDLALAYTKIFDKKTVVTNSYYLEKNERIIIITGANQGGKSTFARAFGQINYLASLGLQVPAHRANLFLTDSIFTHFEKEEDIGNLRSKLQDDLTRVHHIFEMATAKSLVILNEIFSSTSLKDAIFLSQKIMDRVSDLDLLCVWVTFIDDLNKMSGKTVSMVSEIDVKNIDNRTYKIVRKQADGLAYAKTIAKKYQLRYEQILTRIDGV